LPWKTASVTVNTDSAHQIHFEGPQSRVVLLRGHQPYHQLRVGWMVGPGYGLVDPEVQATVRSAAEALKGISIRVEKEGIQALERDFALDVFNKLHIMEIKPAFAVVTVGHADVMFKMSETDAVASRTDRKLNGIAGDGKVLASVTKGQHTVVAAAGSLDG
jgi:hypothetical protein